MVFDGSNLIHTQKNLKSGEVELVVSREITADGKLRAVS